MDPHHSARARGRPRFRRREPRAGHTVTGPEAEQADELIHLLRVNAPTQADRKRLAGLDLDLARTPAARCGVHP
ncbi:hypothetical protein OG555_13470 [Kribbella sp. NBC_01484]|uniref:hypothetical protein n=1 Tax=Kribbella sp. NBC_01484 TaxID=2903579 RepID=UPI002E2FF946|nr:hypothetical protein [Kribbella sp. NBC_01484]